MRTVLSLRRRWLVSMRLPAALRPPERYLAPLVVGWLALVATALWMRPPLPRDETRYLSVAWEMWLRGDFLVPYLNGAPYPHKPPLLFWLMQAGWVAFGVNEWWPRMVAPLFALASLFLTALLGRRIWAQRAECGTTAAWILFGSFLFAVFTTATMFDALVMSFTLLGVHGVVRASQGQLIRGFAQLAAAIGLGALAKGPVILLHLTPVALLAPWWMAHPRPALARWYLGVGAAALFGAGIALTWALPAGLAGGLAYRNSIFWDQTAGRMAQSFAHRLPWWWYLPMLPAILFPWLVWPPLWRALKQLRTAPSNPGTRLLIAWTVPAFIGFSLVSGKQPHYLLPLFPGFALLAEHALRTTRDAPQRYDMLPPALALIAAGAAWAGAGFAPQRFTLPTSMTELSPLPGIAVALLGTAMLGFAHIDLVHRVRVLAAVSPALVLAIHLGIMRPLSPANDLHRVGDHLRFLQQAGVPIANVGQYQGQFHFVGQLTRPLEVVERDEVQHWMESNPRGRVISYTSTRWYPRGKLEFSQDFPGEGRVLVWGPAPGRALNAAR